MKTPLKEQLKSRIELTKKQINYVDPWPLYTILMNQLVIMESLMEIVPDNSFDVGMSAEYFPLHPNKQKP
jgi:hypothetical protein